MKFNFKTILGLNKREQQNSVEIDYSKYVDFYYKNLINSLILFSLTAKELEKLVARSFNPIFELESEIEYAYTPICFDAIFKKGLINPSLREELLNFKKQVDEVPSEIWDFQFIDNHNIWISIRIKANELLDKLNITNRKYNDEYTTVYDENGKILKTGKK